MFGGHIWELVIVLALALVVFGPKRLPEIGGAMGKGIREFKKGTSELAELGDVTKTEPPVSPPAATACCPRFRYMRQKALPVPPCDIGPQRRLGLTIRTKIVTDRPSDVVHTASEGRSVAAS